ncbi:2120_t:CDS:1, partial [Acaulospora morrowiae]
GGAEVTDANLLPNSILNITVKAPNTSVKAPDTGTGGIGHFTMSIDGLRDRIRFLKNPIWVEGCSCSKCENMPLSYTSHWAFPGPAPPKGTYFDVWIAVYWECD